MVENALNTMVLRAIERGDGLIVPLVIDENDENAAENTDS